MNMGQMLIVLLGLALFSTLIMSYYSTFANQIDWIDKNQIQKQALRIVDFQFQLIESRIISGTSISTLLPEYGNFYTAEDTLYVNNIPYKIYLRAQPSKADGDTLNVIGPPEYMKVNARIVAYRTDKDSVQVGLIDVSISKVFGDVFDPGS